MKNGKTEIILFLPISNMQRFTQVAMQDAESTQYKPLRDFVLSYFKEGHKMLSNKVSVDEFIFFLKEALRYENRFYTTSYSIQRDNSNYFALFFISPHLYGFEKILEVKWTLDTELGRGFTLRSLENTLFDDFFAEESQMLNSDRLKEIIMLALEEPKTNGDIYELVLQNEFLPKHANEVFREIQRTNSKFKVINMPTNIEARKNSFYLNWKDTRNPQFIFTFASN